MENVLEELERKYRQDPGDFELRKRVYYERARVGKRYVHPGKCVICRKLSAGRLYHLRFNFQLILWEKPEKIKFLDHKKVFAGSTLACALCELKYVHGVMKSWITYKRVLPKSLEDQKIYWEYQTGKRRSKYKTNNW